MLSSDTKLNQTLGYVGKLIISYETLNPEERKKFVAGVIDILESSKDKDLKRFLELIVSRYDD